MWTILVEQVYQLFRFFGCAPSHLDLFAFHEFRDGGLIEINYFKGSILGNVHEPSRIASRGSYLRIAQFQPGETGMQLTRSLPHPQKWIVHEPSSLGLAEKLL
jgi:hypothetical protein